MVAILDLQNKQKLFSISGVGGTSLSTEPQKPESTFVQVTGGRTLTLNCTLTQMDLPTSARWYKESSNNVWKLIYKESDQNSRGVRLIPGSRTDFSISLSNVGPKDNGTYRCQMIDKVLQLGQSNIKKQVAVYVRVPPTVSLETNPPSPVQLNASVTVTCKAEYFYPNVAKVDLFCKNPSGKGKSTGATFNSNRTYSRQSSLKITATNNWNSSLFTCLVKHNSTVFKATASLVITTELGEGQRKRITGLCDTATVINMSRVAKELGFGSRDYEDAITVISVSRVFSSQRRRRHKQTHKQNGGKCQPPQSVLPTNGVCRTFGRDPDAACGAESCEGEGGYTGKLGNQLSTCKVFKLP
ncbi:tyrosine-protein phosphatase non-receptor type substrate 1-like [Pantherophis guttatus]|uniref:Tyrosine-protein phosphatase non-receptor type substrate 1-like n=1 Tax=Pantherophis guttatus TaxID=94885 RepID=A0ABM3YYC1_PANGU|nr:tyrosine-protein phosphatase non-receptor type substrate 1-like [Pantherophis guttatus]